jgi:hypothetical protein
VKVANAFTQFPIVLDVTFVPNRFFMRKSIQIVLFILLPLLLFSQENPVNDSISKAKINVYIDCNSCDMNYVKEEVGFVNYVRDRAEAQVHILTTSEPSGSGGTRYSVLFYGLREFLEKNDTITFNSQADATEDAIRIQFVKTFKLGLIGYINKSDIAALINISFINPDNEEQAKDKWNNWTFSVSSSSWLSGEKTHSNFNIYSDFAVSKVMPEWKTSFSVSQSYNESRYSLEEYDYYYKSINRDFDFDFEYVGTISNHWSWGAFLKGNSSTYRNLDFSVSFNPGIEYDLFPYSEATTKQVRFVYHIGPDYNNYIDTTIYNKTEQLMLYQSLSVAAKVIQKWGSLSGSVSANTFLNDLSKYSGNIYLMTSVRLLKGLELQLAGNFSSIHNQIGIPKGDVTQEELLLQQRQLETQYNYWANIGLTYTFGSIYNTVVNPRFGF